MIRYIDNLTILANVGDTVYLPSEVVARKSSGGYMVVPISWNENNVDTSEEGEFIFVGRVAGYIHEVLCAVQVGRAEDNPASTFPEKLDEFGLPKKDIQTADIPDIDDYQYFKAKTNRRPSENENLKKLRELLADKIILARDVNHMRNAIIELEKYCLELQRQIDELRDRVDDLEDRMDKAEEDITELQSKTISGRKGIEVNVEGNDTVVQISDYIAFTEFFGMKMVDVKDHADETRTWKSLLWVLGAGWNDRMDGSARILKATNGLIFEYKKTDKEGYSGFFIGERGFDPYPHSDRSLIDAELVGEEGEEVSAYDLSYSKLDITTKNPRT